MRIRALSDADPDIITAKCDSINKKLTRKEKIGRSFSFLLVSRISEYSDPDPNFNFDSVAQPRSDPRINRFR